MSYRLVGPGSAVAVLRRKAQSSRTMQNSFPSGVGEGCPVNKGNAPGRVDQGRFRLASSKCG